MVRLQSTILRLAIPLLVLAHGGPAAARDIAGWTISSDTRTCSMSATFADEVALALVWAPESEVLSVLAAGAGWRDLRRMEGETTGLALKFDGPVEYDEWIAERARVVSAGGHPAIVADWGSDLSRELASTVTGSSGVALSVGGRHLGTYDLSGSGAAYRELLRCGRELLPAGG